MTPNPLRTQADTDRARRELKMVAVVMLSLLSCAVVMIVWGGIVGLIFGWTCVALIIVGVTLLSVSYRLLGRLDDLRNRRESYETIDRFLFRRWP